MADKRERLVVELPDVTSITSDPEAIARNAAQLAEKGHEHSSNSRTRRDLRTSNARLVEENERLRAERDAAKWRAERAESDKATLMRLVTATEERRDEYRDRMYAAEQQARAYREALETIRAAHHAWTLGECSSSDVLAAIAAAEQEKPGK